MKKTVTIGRAAYHEAGHAVAAIVLDVPLTLVSIEQQQGPFGLRIGGATFCPFNFSRALRNRAKSEKYLTVVLAGEVSERLWCAHKPTHPIQEIGFSLDREVVREMLKQVFKYRAERQRVLKHLKGEARRLVRNHWNSVELLAGKLEEFKVLNGAMVKRLIEPPKKS